MKTIGVVGGGQLARMMIPAAIDLGLDLRVFSEAEDSSARLATTTVGDYRNSDDLKDFVGAVDVLTFDHEHVPTQVLKSLQSSGVVVAPPPDALALTHNKIVMRDRLAGFGVPQPRWSVVDDLGSRDSALAAVGGFPCVAKKPVGGYDGKGVRVIESWDGVEDWCEEGPVLLEEKVAFDRELALLSARRQGGEWVPWLPVETRQVDGVCSEVVAPAPAYQDIQSQAETISREISEKLGIVGVLAVEVFQVDGDTLLVNELAMRPHNSGHVLTELSATSQFEQHLRAVADLPLGSPDLVSGAGVMVNVFGSIDDDARARAWSAVPEAKIHDYGKSAREGRKVGHLVVTGSESAHVRERARQAHSLLVSR